MAKAAMVPSSTEAVALTAATRSDSHKASPICALRNNSPYQRVENPLHTVTSRLSLNE